jgi:hypothetical protein
MAEFAKLIGDVRGIDHAPIRFEVADDLSRIGVQKFQEKWSLGQKH